VHFAPEPTYPEERRKVSLWLLATPSAFGEPAQPVDATQALNLSAGVSNCKVSRGRSLS